jgi:hypothetical protein
MPIFSLPMELVAIYLAFVFVAIGVIDDSSLRSQVVVHERAIVSCAVDVDHLAETLVRVLEEFTHVDDAVG